MLMNVRPSYPELDYVNIIDITPEDRIFTSNIGIRSVSTWGPLYYEGEAYPQKDTATYYPSGHTPPGYIRYGFRNFTVHPISQAELTATGTESEQTFKPSNNDAFLYNKVTVTPNLLQSKPPVTPSATSQPVTPDSGYYALNSVTVKGLPLETKNVPSITQNDQVFTPSSGYYGFKQINVPASTTLKMLTVTRNRPDNIPNTVGFSTIYTISILTTNSNGYVSHYNGVNMITGSSSLGGVATIIWGYGGDSMLQQVVNFNTLVTLSSSNINIDVDQFGCRFDGEYQVFITGA